MSDPQLTRIAIMSDPILAEMLRGLLEAQGIPVMLSKEGASIAYGLNVGKFAEVEVFVPGRHAEQAKQIYSENFGGEDAAADQG